MEAEDGRGRQEYQKTHNGTTNAQNALCVMQSLCRDARAVPAGGALEIEVARQLRKFGSKETGLDQYAIAKFAEALEVVPRTIAENSGTVEYSGLHCNYSHSVTVMQVTVFKPSWYAYSSGVDNVCILGDFRRLQG
jgi:chaperonin GroEL (HSP60 family)